MPLKLAAVAHSTIPSTKLRMALPQELSNRSAHRVADRNASLDTHRAEKGGDVVGTVLQPERSTAAQAAPVTALVQCENLKTVGRAARSWETS